MGLKFSGTNYEDQNGIEKYIKDGTIIMSSELESTGNPKINKYYSKRKEQVSEK